jgi:hypothetical protein
VVVLKELVGSLVRRQPEGRCHKPLQSACTFRIIPPSGTVLDFRSRFPIALESPFLGSSVGGAGAAGVAEGKSLIRFGWHG